MKKMILTVLLFASLAIVGCSGDSAEDLFDTAQLEELQNNPDHARQLYQKIVSEHPDSGFAQKARERLAKMDEKD
jgi:TolA-binding protein